MALIDSKITDAEIAAAGVQSQPNKLTGTAAQNKAVFDALVKNLVKGKLNDLIDALTGAGAAGQIGVDTISGLTVSTVQEALQAIVEAMADITQGSVADGSISTAKLAALAVTTAKLAAGAVTAEKLAERAVTTDKLDAEAVTTAKIAALAVTAALIAAGAVTTEKIADLAVTGAKIANAAVDNTKLAEAAVTAVKIAAGAVSSAKIADGAVTAAKQGFVKFGTAVPTTAHIAEGEIYLKYEA